MGLGSAMGSAIDGWNASATDRRNEEKMDMARTAQAQNQEYRGMQMEALQGQMDQRKVEYAATQTPEAKKYKAAKMKAETEKYKMQAGFFSDMSSDAAQLQETQNKLTQVTMDFENKADVDHTVETKNNMYTIIGDGGQIGDNELNQFNAIIESNPEFLKKSFPNPVVLANPNNKKHTQGLNDYATKLLEAQGIDLTKFPADKADELLEDTLGSVEELARVGYIVVDNETGVASSLDSLFGQLGNSERTPSTLTNKVTSVVRNTAERVATKNMSKRNLGLNEMPEWQKDDVTGTAENKGPKTFEGKDASKYTQALKIAGIPISPELEAINKYNAGLINPKEGKTKDSSFWSGATPEQLQEGITNLITGAIDESIGDEEISQMEARAKAGISLMKDEGERKKARTQLDSALRYREGAKYVNSTEEDSGSHKRAMAIEREFNSESSTREVKDALQAEVAFDKGLTSIMGDLVQIEKEGGMANAAMASTKVMGMIGLSSETAAGIYNSISTTFGGDAVTKKDIMTVIGFNTKIGKIIATYLKQTSGAGVSDSERENIQNLFLGAMGADSKTMMKALSSFREATQLELGAKLDETMYGKLPITMKAVKTAAEDKTDYRGLLDQAVKDAPKFEQDRKNGLSTADKEAEILAGLED